MTRTPHIAVEFLANSVLHIGTALWTKQCCCLGVKGHEAVTKTKCKRAAAAQPTADDALSRKS